MNKKNTLLLALSAMLTAATMQAAPVTHSPVNLYAGFWRVNDLGAVTRNYVARIGSRTTINAQTDRTVLANLGSDLDTVFGSGWYNGGADTNKVYWGVYSWSSTTSNTNYVVGLNESANSATAVTKDNVLGESTSDQLGDANSTFSLFSSAYENLRLNSWENSTGQGALDVGVGMTGADVNSFANMITASPAWGVGALTSGNLVAWVGDQASGGKAGDQWIWAATRKIDESDDTNNSRFFKQLTVESNGQVMVIPEPSTYALFGFGLLLMVVAYRRKISS
jgi:hypothetical protein